MKHTTYKFVLAAILFFSGIVLFTSCKKDENNNTPSWPGNQILIDKDFLVSYAKDNGGNITANYAGYTFRFAGPPSLLTGTATVTNTLLTITGTWTMTAGRDRITFAFPTNLFPELSYMNKTWIVTNATANPVVLNATFGEDDELRLTLK